MKLVCCGSPGELREVAQVGDRCQDERCSFSMVRSQRTNKLFRKVEGLQASVYVKDERKEGRWLKYRR